MVFPNSRPRPCPCFNPQPHRSFKTKKPFRWVEPFSVSSFYQKNAKVYPQPKVNIFEERNPRTSLFRMLLLRGDIPCKRSYNSQNEIRSGMYLLWKVPPQDLDYCHYLPIFFDGLSETHFPYNVHASYAIHDMLNAAAEKLLPVLPQLIVPMNKALNTRNVGCIGSTLQIIQRMCMCSPCVGKALVPFYRQILPVLNIYYGKNENFMDRIDFIRVGRIGDIIDDTLMMLERCGGRNAFINIKYTIPAYESCVNN